MRRQGLVAAWVALAVAASAVAGCAGSGSVPLWEQPPAPVADSPVVDGERLHRTRLENGLEILVFEDARLPRLALGVTARRGAGMVPPEQAGLAQFTAELMTRGAGDRDALALAEAVDALGASYGVSAGWDSTTVSVSGLSRDLDTLFSVLVDLTRDPRFDPAEAKKVREDQLAALEKAKDSPRTLASRSFATALYSGHRFGLPEDGVPEVVRGLGPTDARNFHVRVFTPPNMIFYATGDVSAEDIEQRVRAAFGDWQGGPVPEPGAEPPQPAPPERRVVIVDRPDLGQAEIVVGHDGIRRDAEDRVAVALMNTILGGGGFSSRLMGKVRADEGLTYGVYSAFSRRRQRGPFVVATFTRVSEVRRVVDLVLAEMERVRMEPPGAEELRNAQSLTAGRFALGLETSAAVTAALVDLEVHGLPPDSLDTFRRRVRDVDVAETARVARAHVHPERAAVVVVGPADQLRPQLEGLGPIEVVQP